MKNLKNLTFAIILVAMMGVADHLIGYKISFSIFYFIPILFITWFGPISFGIVIAILSAVAWGVADLTSGQHYSNSLILVWNATMRLMIFLGMVYLVSRLKKALSEQGKLTEPKFDFMGDIFQGQKMKGGDLPNLALAIMLVAMLGSVDYLTGYKISFSIFYFIPILFITWAGPSSLGIVVAILSAVVWGVADLSSGQHYFNPLILVWNATMRLMIFLGMVYLTSRLKKALSEQGKLTEPKFDFMGDIFHGQKIKKSDLPYLALAIMLVIMMGFTDYLTGYEISFSIFYFIPILIITWFGPGSFGIVIAILSAVVWGVADLTSGQHYSHSLVLVWNATMRLMIFLCVVYFTCRFKRALNAEKELSERKSAFVANVSHELRNPLAIIRESFSLVLDKIAGEVNEEQKKFLEMGRRSANRLIRLVGDLLDLSQIEAGKMKLKREEVALEVLVEEVLKTYEKEISKKRLILKNEAQQNIGLLWGDSDKLTEVIINLLNNAIKYTSEGSITVKLTGSEKEVRFEISDTGSGIPLEYREKIFDKFERIMTEKQEGTGLGLPIAKDIIGLHQGKLWVESEAGKGSKFIFTIPRGVE